MRYLSQIKNGISLNFRILCVKILVLDCKIESDFKIKAGENCVGAMGSFSLATTFYITKTRQWAN